MAAQDTLARLAAEGNGVAIDPARLTGQAALVADMNALVGAAAKARLGLGDSPWSLQSFRLEQAAAAKARGGAA
jgi:hypothetical protein